MKHRLAALLICLAGIATLQAQTEYRVESQATASVGDHSPLWLNANRHGLSSIDRNNGYVRASLLSPAEEDTLRQWEWGYGVDVALAAGFTSTVVVQQAFGELRYQHGLLTIGAKEQPMQLKNQRLSSGSQTFGINARPVPQVRLEVPHYWTVPGTRGWLALKGHIAYGKTTDDRWQKDFVQTGKRYTQDALFHSKAGYLRLGPKSLTLEAGLEMACQFAGKSFDCPLPGEVIVNEADLPAFWHAFIPGGHDVTDGSFLNIEGNHLGSWVFRLNYDQPSWRLSAYVDQYFEDQGMMFHISRNGYGLGDEKHTMVRQRYFIYDFSDGLVGLELELKRSRGVQHVVVEYLGTKYQGGPVYHDNTANIAEHICGTDNYYNHHIYTGWQHWGMVMGNPLYLSPLYNDDHLIEVENNRFTAWHLGLDGRATRSLDYRLLATWQRGLGTHHLLYVPQRENVSLMAEANLTLAKGWSVTGALGMDAGKIYGNNFGVQITVARKGWLKHKEQ